MYTSKEIELVKPQFDFIVDKENKVIRFAGMEFKRFKLYADAKKVLSDFEAWNLPISGKHKNPTARAFSDKYGITASKFKAVFNAKMLNLWVDPIKEHANRFAYNSNGKLKDYMVCIIWEMLPEIEQAKKDGIYNIVPWILHEGKNPQELKEHFGKSVWKSLCKQTMTRNKLIASNSKRFRYGEESIHSAIKLPSYLLKRGGNQQFSWDWTTEYLFANNLLNGKHFKRTGSAGIREQVRLRNILVDTKRMAGTLGKGFNVSWSPEKMKQKHEEYVELINLKRYSPEPYECLKHFKVKQIEHEGFVATLLDSAALIHREGKEMHHCVGGYASYVADGNYLVYSITKDGERSSTIAFRKWVWDEEWQFNQHYGHCNAHVEDKHEKEFKDILLELLNEKEVLAA